jgi:hypothetical protein
MIISKQHTVTWHVNNLKSSHINLKVNDEFLSWLKSKYASDKISKIKAVQGSIHNYLAITLDFTIPKVLQVNITQYVKKSKNSLRSLVANQDAHGARTYTRFTRKHPSYPKSKARSFTPLS